MEALQDIAHISGKGGLFKILKPGRSGVIVESLDGIKEKQLVSSNAQVSILKDISMYTNDSNQSVPLGDIFKNIKAKHPNGLDLDGKAASKTQLFDFLGEVLPNYDGDRIRESDIKKLINWFKILDAFLPEIFTETETEK
jgi:hypothetical protein